MYRRVGVRWRLAPGPQHAPAFSRTALWRLRFWIAPDEQLRFNFEVALNQKHSPDSRRYQSRADPLTDYRLLVTDYRLLRLEHQAMAFPAFSSASDCLWAADRSKIVASGDDLL
jgi:hypothetical protein